MEGAGLFSRTPGRADAIIKLAVVSIESKLKAVQNALSDYQKASNVETANRLQVTVSAFLQDKEIRRFPDIALTGGAPKSKAKKSPKAKAPAARSKKV